MAWRDDSPKTTWFRERLRKGSDLLCCVHVASVKTNAGEALVTLHADGDCRLAFSFITSTAEAASMATLAPFLERVYGFALKRTPPDCTRTSAADPESPVVGCRRVDGSFVRTLAGHFVRGVLTLWGRAGFAACYLGTFLYG